MLNSWPLAKDLQVLVEIVHSGSFSAAAATLGQTPAFVTKRIDLGCHMDDVNVKATTTEKLGFTGRGEGIACEAVALLIKATK